MAVWAFCCFIFIFYLFIWLGKQQGLRWPWQFCHLVLHRNATSGLLITRMHKCHAEMLYLSTYSDISHPLNNQKGFPICHEECFPTTNTLACLHITLAPPRVMC